MRSWKKIPFEFFSSYLPWPKLDLYIFFLHSRWLYYCVYMCVFLDEIYFILNRNMKLKIISSYFKHVIPNLMCSLPQKLNISVQIMHKVFQFQWRSGIRCAPCSNNNNFGQKFEKNEEKYFPQTISLVINRLISSFNSIDFLLEARKWPDQMIF